MGQRFLDAIAETRVSFRNNGMTQEFCARFKATKFSPMVVSFERDGRPEKVLPGGRLLIESRGFIATSQKVVPTLPIEAEAQIEVWLLNKRHEMLSQAEAAFGEGATRIKINKKGEVTPS
jgi:hypothetical protein